MKLTSKLILLFIIGAKILSIEANDPPGHLQPLGSHTEPMEIEVRCNQLGPIEFYDKYVIPGKPVLLKGAAKTFPGYNNWRNDEFLKKHYGKWEVDAEIGKKETRSGNMVHMTYGDYLDKYNSSDMYLVSDIKPDLPISAEVFLPRCMLCGGLSDTVITSVMWFSSGGTKSVLHNDDLENINCLYDGSKELVMIDKIHKDLMPIDRPQGGYSSVDVEKVDMYKFPTLGKFPWYRAKMEAGDCFYIPYQWYHQVDSSKSRNLAINLWFQHTTFLTKRNECPKDPSTLPNHQCLNTVTFLTDEDQSKYQLINFFNTTTQTMTMNEFKQSLLKRFPKIDEKSLKVCIKVFQLVDKNNDNMLTFEEGKSASNKYITVLMNVFEDMYELHDNATNEAKVTNAATDEAKETEATTAKKSPEDPPGHLKPLGSHTPPQSVEVRHDWPNPVEFFEKYQKPGKPVHFRGIAKKYPTFKNFQDDTYLKEHFGDWDVDAEEGKKEDRDKDVFKMKFSEYLDTYNNRDMYLVQDIPIPSKLSEHAFIPKPLLCGGFTDKLSTSIMWFSSGGTKSVLHNDGTENINCLFHGTKNIVMIDRKHETMVPIDRDGGYSSLDVDKVDMHKYPSVSKLPWYNVSMTAGDCLYIPMRWYHQIYSLPTRNLAINLWWNHLYQFENDCPSDVSKLPDYKQLSNFKYVTGQQPRENLLSMFDENSGTIIFRQLQKRSEEPEKDLRKFFTKADSNGDGILTYKEVFALPMSDFDMFDYREETEQNEQGRDEL